MTMMKTVVVIVVIIAMIITVDALETSPNTVELANVQTGPNPDFVCESICQPGVEKCTTSCVRKTTTDTVDNHALTGVQVVVNGVPLDADANEAVDTEMDNVGVDTE